jgi:hypothetical protein
MYQRLIVYWCIKSDGIFDLVIPVPKTNLSQAERKKLLNSMTSEAFKNLPKSNISLSLVDEAIDLGLVSPAFCVLHIVNLQHFRGLNDM